MTEGMNPKMFACINRVMSAVLTKKARNNLVVMEVENFVIVLYLLNFPSASMTFWSKIFTSIMTIPVTIVSA